MTDPGKSIVLRFATRDDVHALRQLRADIFRGELKVQNEHYQDVFADAYSKNVALFADGRLIGAVRLAFSREQQEFYISYLLLARQYRTRGLIGLLLGAVFLMMEANQLDRVRADAADDNLPMYLEAGCEIVGDRYRKYGFECEWTPVVYRLGTNPSAERAAMSRAERHIPRNRALLWHFEPGIALCPDLDTYRRQAVSVRASDIAPHLGPAVPAMQSRWIRLRQIPLAQKTEAGLSPEAGQHDHDFAYLNARFGGDRVIVLRRGSELAEPAKLYGLLTGKHVIFVSSWTALEAADLSHARNVLFVAARGELAELAVALAGRHDLPPGGIATAGDPAELSELLLRNFFEFLGPCPAVPGASMLCEAGTKEAVSFKVDLHRSDEASLAEALADASTIIHGTRTHCVVAHRNVPGPALDALSGLISSGYAIGTAVRMVSVSCATQMPWPLGLIGDPGLRFTPSHLSLRKKDDDKGQKAASLPCSRQEPSPVPAGAIPASHTVSLAPGDLNAGIVPREAWDGPHLGAGLARIGRTVDRRDPTA